MLGLGLGLSKGSTLLSNLKLLTRNSDFAFWIDKATGTSKGTNTPQVNPIVDLVGVVGKNLFDPVVMPIFNTPGVVSTPINDGINIKSPTSAQYRRSIYFQKVLPNTNYNFSFIATKLSGVDDSRVIITKGSDGVPSGSLPTALATITGNDARNGYFNTGEESFVYITFFVTFTTASISEFNYTNIMLNEGTTATAYEPYGKSNGLLQGFAFTPASGYVDVVAPNGKTVTGIQGDGVNDVIVLPSNAPNPVGLQDFGFAFVFKTGATLPGESGYIFSRSDTGLTTMQYGLFYDYAGTLSIVIENVTITSAMLSSNTFYKMILKRVNGRLILKIQSSEVYNQPNSSVLTTRSKPMLFARADASTFSRFANHILLYDNYNNGDNIDEWESDQNKAIAKIYGL